MSDRNGLTGAGLLVPGAAVPARARAKRKGRKSPARSGRASGSRTSPKAAAQARAARSSPSPGPAACDSLAVQAASEAVVGANPDLVAVVPRSGAVDPDGPAVSAPEPVARAIDPTGETPGFESVAASDVPASTDARPVAGMADVVAASSVGRGRAFARRGLAAIVSTGLIVVGAWALQTGPDRTGRTVIAAAPVGAMPALAGSHVDRQDAAQIMASAQGSVDPGVPGAGWITPPAKVSPVEVPTVEVPTVAAAPAEPRVSPPDLPIADAPSVPTAASGIAPPAASALVPLPPRRPATLAVRRTSPIPPEVASVAPVPVEPARAEANVWSPPREAGRYRLPWGVAQLGERGNDDTARGPQWTFVVER